MTAARIVGFYQLSKDGRNEGGRSVLEPVIEEALCRLLAPFSIGNEGVQQRVGLIALSLSAFLVELGKQTLNGGETDEIGKSQGPLRIVEAQLHGYVDIARQGDRISSQGGLVDSIVALAALQDLQEIQPALGAGAMTWENCPQASLEAGP